MSDRLQAGIKAGSTSVSLDVVLRSSSDGTEVTGKAAADITAYYWRQGGSVTGLTAASDLAAITSAFSAGGWKEAHSTRAAGSYRLDVDDAAFATGADWVEIDVICSGCFVFKERFALTTNVVQSGDAYGIANNVTFGNSALNTVLGVIAGYIDTEVAAIKTKTDQLTFTLANKLDVNALAVASSVTAATRLARASRATVLGTVDSGSTTTIVNTSALDPAATVLDQFRGRVLIFDEATATAELRGQGGPISTSSAGGALTLSSALTTAPDVGDTFTIV